MPNYSEPAYVYIMSEADNAPFKLGVSSDPSSRLRVVRQTTGLRKLRVYRKWYADKLARNIEMLAHEKLANYAIGGEFFGTHPCMGIIFMDMLAEELRLAKDLGPYERSFDPAPPAVLERVQRRINRAWSRWKRIEYIDPGDESDDEPS